MRICLISREYPPETHYGGTGTYSYNMAHALERMGHTVHVLTSTKGNSYAYDESGVIVHRIKERQVKPRELQYALRSLQVSRKIHSLDIRFDVVQAVEWTAEGLFYSFSQKTPLITRLATPLFVVERIAGKTGRLTRGSLVNIMERTQTRRSKGLISSTKALATTVGQAWNLELDRINVIPNSIDLDRMRGFKLLPNELENLDGDYLAYFGRLEGRKGVHVIAEALLPVLEKFPAVRMVFIGKDVGTGTTSMKAHIIETLGRFSNRVLFLESMPQERLFPIVNKAKLVLLPSLWEAFGFVAIEAMSLGRTVIATSGSGFEEIIENAKSGLLVPPGDAGALSAAIQSCLSDDAKLSAIESEAERRVLDFDVNTIAGRLCAFYEDLLRRESHEYARSNIQHV